MYSAIRIARAFPFYLVAYALSLVISVYCAIFHVIPIEKLKEQYPSGRSYLQENFQFLDIVTYPNVNHRKNWSLIRYTEDKLVVRIDDSKEMETSPTVFLANVGSNQSFGIMDLIDKAFVPCANISVGVITKVNQALNSGPASVTSVLVYIITIPGLTLLLLLLCRWVDAHSKNGIGGSMVVAGGILAATIMFLVGVFASNEDILSFLYHLPFSFQLYPWYAIAAYLVIMLPIPCFIIVGAIDMCIAIFKKDFALVAMYPAAIFCAAIFTPLAIHSVLIAIVVAFSPILFLAIAASDTRSTSQSDAHHDLRDAENERDSALGYRVTDTPDDYVRRVEKADRAVEQALDRLRKE